jgi:2-polyprenyl-6-methoxyphenol hydroxylase-like FAD-dependent oxidoreductase
MNGVRSAIVVGAGIGGLAAAIALRQSGWQVRVVERAASPRELGFALLLAPNAMAALESLGVADAVTSRGTVITRGEMRRADGHLLRAIDTGSVRHLLPGPTAMALRQVVHGALLDSVGGDALVLGSPVVAFSPGPDAVTVTCANGATAAGDILIAADGAGSIVRRLLHPDDPPPRSSGLFGLRGVAYGATQHLGDSNGSQYFGCGVEGGIARAGADAVYWYMSLPQRMVADRDDLVVVADRCTRGFDPRVRAIVAATRREDMRLDPLMDRAPIDRWGAGRVTLLGDAAHPMLPHAGQGAAQALEDAVAIGRVLRQPGDPEPALRRYERIRAPRTRRIVALARRNARMGSIESRLGCWARDRAIGMMPTRMILKTLVEMGKAPEIE